MKITDGDRQIWVLDTLLPTVFLHVKKLSKKVAITVRDYRSYRGCSGTRQNALSEVPMLKDLLKLTGVWGTSRPLG